MSATFEAVFYDITTHDALPVDTALTGAAVARILDRREPPPTRREAELLASLLRGHLAVLAREVHNSLLNPVAQPDLCVDVRRALDEATHLLDAPPIYTARRTVSVTPLALCCRDLHRYYAAVISRPLSREP
ncbi:DUF6415 family natural product biosynthesis protein [Streptomyces sp. NPDC001797]|uniref:DUF6415 family natural product biosynthesis protein n=1 Tax=Streptomyces sp. NPDC001797 TaxID=3364610 RepID=UPI0036A42014